MAYEGYLVTGEAQTNIMLDEILDKVTSMSQRLQKNKLPTPGRPPKPDSYMDKKSSKLITYLL